MLTLLKLNYQFSHSVVSISLQPRGLQHAWLPCPSPIPGAYSNSCSLSQWCHQITSSSVVTFSFCLQSFPVSSNESALRIRWPKYWSFSFKISPSNEHLGLISFRMDWLDLCAVQGILKNSSVLSFLYGPTLTSIHDYWKNRSLDYADLWWQSNVSAF